jgi:hypothetical protein
MKRVKVVVVDAGVVFMVPNVLSVMCQMRRWRYLFNFPIHHLLRHIFFFHFFLFLTLPSKGTSDVGQSVVVGSMSKIKMRSRHLISPTPDKM